MSKNVYQLVAVGASIMLNDKKIITSKKVFESKQMAMDFKEKFKELCTTPKSANDYEYLVSVDLIHVIELELVEENEA